MVKNRTEGKKEREREKWSEAKREKEGVRRKRGYYSHTKAKREI